MSEKLDGILEQLKAFLDSEEGKTFVKEEQNRMLFHREHINKYVEKLFNMGPIMRDVLFSKIKTKYDSDEYYHRWIDRGIEPPEVLYDYILEYGFKHGIPNTIEDAHFGYDSYIIDDTWIITCWYGQGTAYNFNRIK